MTHFQVQNRNKKRVSSVPSSRKKEGKFCPFFFSFRLMSNFNVLKVRTLFAVWERTVEAYLPGNK